MIETVLGPVEASALGATSTHDHLLADASGLQRAGVEKLDPDALVTPELAGALRWSQLALADNLRLEDPAVIAAELGLASRLGQRTSVEVSSLGMGPDHAGLPAIARATGMNIVAAYGAYIPRLLPEWFLALDVEGRTALFTQALEESIPGVDFKAGLLGLLGTTGDFGSPAGEQERISLTAAARAAVRSGSAISIRLAAEARNGLEILEHVVVEGVSPDKVVFANTDEYLDHAYLRDLGQAGATLELCWGNEGTHVGRIKNASDRDRIESLMSLLESDPGLRWTFGTSLWTKSQLRRFGGHGYEHLLARVLPGLLELGVPEATLTRIIVTEPARLLDRAA